MGKHANRFDLIALDVDGTLLDDEHLLRPATKAAVQEASRRGIEIVLCTGRGPLNTIPVLEELGLTGTMITHNGAAVVDAATRRVLHQSGFTHELVLPFIDYCRRGGHHFDICTAFELFTEGLTPETKEMYSLFDIKPVMRTAEEPLPEGLVKLTAFGGQAEMDHVQAEWESWGNISLQVIRSGIQFIDVQLAAASKGQALAELARLRGYDRSRVMAIGNYYNDVGMLEYAGLGIAMDNSPEDVKAAADAVTGSNNADGVAEALQKYLLNH